jgi:hypothetical protein
MGHMSTQMQEGKDVPHDTFEARLAMARFHAGHLSAAEAGLRSRGRSDVAKRLRATRDSDRMRA